MAQKYMFVRGGGEPVNYLQYSGIFDFDGLYKLMHDWLVDRDYYFEEKLFEHKVPSPAGAEQYILWQGWRKVNEWVKYYIDIFIILRDRKEIEVVKQGEKKKLIKARLLIVFYGKVEMDYSKRFASSQLGRALHHFLIHYVWKPEKEVANYWDELYYRVYKLHRVVKEHLDMEAKGNAYYDMW